MRKATVALAIIVFGVYCVQSMAHYTRVDVPGYEQVDVDLLGGKTRAQWQEDVTFQKRHIDQLARLHLKPTKKGLTVQTADGSERTLDPDTVLGDEEFADLIRTRLAEIGGNLPAEPLRDAGAVMALVTRNVKLRDPVQVGNETIPEGTRITKPVVDKLLDGDIKTIGIVGTGEAVSIELGTTLMVIIIFLGLNAALTEVLWNPVLKMMDERNAEIEQGSGLVRENRDAAEEVEAEGARLHGQARREYLAKLSATQREAQQEADKIMTDARVQARLMRDKAQEELRGVVAEARSELEGKVPDLAEKMAAQVLGQDKNDG